MSDPAEIQESHFLSTLQGLLGLHPPTPSRKKILPRAQRRLNFEPKGQGYFGPFRNPHTGEEVTELSTGLPGFYAKSVRRPLPAEDYHPLITPNQSADALLWLITGGRPTPEIRARAEEHAKARKAQGLSPFAGPDETPLPVPEGASEDAYYRPLPIIGKPMDRLGPRIPLSQMPMGEKGPVLDALPRKDLTEEEIRRRTAEAARQGRTFYYDESIPIPKPRAKIYGP